MSVAYPNVSLEYVSYAGRSQDEVEAFVTPAGGYTSVFLGTCIWKL